MRPYAKLTLPNANGGKTTLVLIHESFVNLNKSPFQTVGGEDRMRNCIGINTPLAQHVNVEAGYL